MKNYLKLSLTSFILMIVMTGCYRMPRDDEYSVIPTTNNPNLTREKNTFVPNMPY